MEPVFLPPPTPQKRADCEGQNTTSSWIIQEAHHKLRVPPCKGGFEEGGELLIFSISVLLPMTATGSVLSLPSYI